MNHIARCLSVVAVFVLFMSQGYSQINTEFSLLKDKKYTLVSSLDLLAKLPDYKIQTVKKQRSIFDVEKLPIFCKFEHKISQKSKLNLRMRLGSLDYVNKLEGKN